jgi:hypothetical protein
MVDGKMNLHPLQTEQLPAPPGTVSIEQDENLRMLTKIDSSINQPTKSKLKKSGTLSFRI